jgi:isopenicillin N synthase-like dioxygenase
MQHHVPVLDIGRIDSDRQGLVSEAGRAYREYGFCGFYNHGIPDVVIEDACETFRRFFTLPTASKLRYRSAAGGQRGYTPFGVEQARDHKIPDLKEFWHLGREFSDDAAVANPWPEILEPNVWPVEIEDFREKSSALYDQFDALGRRILRIIAQSLGLDRDWFDDAVLLGNSILRAIHYPPVSDRDTPAVRAARHEDINLITLLIGSNQAGLEILAHDGSWVPVTSIPGTIVVNIGDMMKRLTNHVLPSTPHRVVNPPLSRTVKSRYSMPFFMHPSPDFLIETLPTCISEDNPDRYPQAITANDFLEQRLREIKLL